MEESNIMNKVKGAIEQFFVKDNIQTPLKKSGKSLEENKMGEDSKKEDLRSRMGSEIFDYYYQFLQEKRSDPMTDEAQLRSQLNEMIGTNKQLKNLMFELEQIIFKEMQAKLYS